ncbi:SANT/Myb_domain [Hexamita inflata]|uniref:SANT/Myb domain n=1 Tax=Hexamita inflata TaxID=28002 RepID=A0AA86PRG8_9EUKA|nr:SANT/Myb domain [Hexamita inflata]
MLVVLSLGDNSYNQLVYQLSFDLNLKTEIILQHLLKISTSCLYSTQSQILVEATQNQLSETEIKHQLAQQSKCSDLTQANSKISFPELDTIEYQKQSISQVQELFSDTTVQNNQNVDFETKPDKVQRQSKSELNSFKLSFSSALKMVLSSYFTNLHEVTDSQICEAVNAHVKINDQIKFWDSVQRVIGVKTREQVRNYYQKTYVKCLYKNEINKEDKETLNKLIEENGDKKAAEIAKLFANESYFHRTVLMYVINRIAYNKENK